MSLLDRLRGKKEEKIEKTEGKTEKIKAEKSVKGEPVSGKKKIAKVEKITKIKKETAKRKVVSSDENIAHRILIENLITEKSTMLGAENKYVFKVAKHAGKFQIKEAIEKYYGVQVIGLNTITISPKKRIHGRTVGWKKGFKKAVVTLRAGDTIAAVEGV